MDASLEFVVCWLAGGNTSLENNPKHDGDDGTSFLSPEGMHFLSVPLKGNAKKTTKNNQKSREIVSGP